MAIKQHIKILNTGKPKILPTAKMNPPLSHMWRYTSLNTTYKHTVKRVYRHKWDSLGRSEISITNNSISHYIFVIQTQVTLSFNVVCQVHFMLHDKRLITSFKSKKIFPRSLIDRGIIIKKYSDIIFSVCPAKIKSGKYIV